MVKNNLLDKKVLDFNLSKLAEFIDPERDKLLEYMGLRTLYDRYFI